MLNLLAVSGLAAALLTGPAAIDVPTSPPGEKITITVVTVNGSGCPAGTAAVAPSPDNTAFTVTYSDFLAQVGVGAKPTDFRKNCQLNIKIHVPQGFTYAIAAADYRGFGSLERGARAVQRASYYFMGTTPTTAISHTFNGPLSDDWHATDQTDVASLVYAPCGEDRNLNVNTELRVYAGTSNPRTSTSFMTMDSTDGSVSTRYHFAWKHCDD
jgi:hypothetical protein